MFSHDRQTDIHSLFCFLNLPLFFLLLGRAKGRCFYLRCRRLGFNAEILSILTLAANLDLKVSNVSNLDWFQKFFLLTFLFVLDRRWDRTLRWQSWKHWIVGWFGNGWDGRLWIECGFRTEEVQSHQSSYCRSRWSNWRSKSHVLYYQESNQARSSRILFRTIGFLTEIKVWTQ